MDTLKEVRILDETPASPTKPNVHAARAPPPPLAMSHLKMSTCHRCINRYPIADDDRGCPLHPECDVGTCKTHQPEWRRFCGQPKLTDDQRCNIRRWITDVAPDITPERVNGTSGMSDAELCEELTIIDDEWRRPSTAPANFACEGEDALSRERLVDVPHEVLGTFSMPSSCGKRTQTLCADIRAVDNWWKQQDLETRPRTVPQFHGVDKTDEYYRRRVQKWEGRMRFYKEQFDADPRAAQIRVLVAQLRSGVGATPDYAVARVSDEADGTLVDRVRIVEAGAVGALVELLSSGSDWGRSQSAYALASLAVDATHRLVIVRAGAVGQLVELLSRGTAGGRANSAFALACLAVNAAHRLVIARAGAVGPLVELLTHGNGPGKANSAGAFANLSADAVHRLAMVRAGAVGPLVGLLTHGGERIRAMSAHALANLATDAAHRFAIVRAGAVAPLVGLLTRSHDTGKANSARALGNLAVNAVNRLTIVSAGAIGPLVELEQREVMSDLQNASRALERLSLDYVHRFAIEEARRIHSQHE